MSRISILLAGTVLIALTAGCAGPEGSPRAALKRNAAFWQRANVSQTALMDGPKAQQMLQRDIARCVTELRELEELGTLRTTAIPSEKKGYHRNNEDQDVALQQAEAPERDAFMLAEKGEYDDFESCMIDKGWQRVEHVPYDLSEKSRTNYLDTIIGERHRSRMGTREYDDEYRQPVPQGDFVDMNR